MPSWKKVITSGSVAALQSLTVSGGITGSLLGTSSWASNAVTSSNALTASYVNPLNQTVIITGSVFFTGSGGGAPAVYIDNSLRVTRAGGSVGFIIDGALGKITGGGNNVVYEPYNYGDASHNFNIGHATVGNFNWSVGTNSTLSSNTQLMRLTRSGSLGIGTTTPSATLDVSGSVNISGSGIQIPFQINAAGTRILHVSGSGKISIGSSANIGNVLEIYDTGIYYAGASSQAQLLITTSGSVNREGAFIAASSGRTLQMGINDNSTVPVGIDMFETNNSYPSSYLNFRVNNADLIRMTGSFVGIGTTSPLASLHISGASSTALLEIDSPALNNILFVSGSGNVGIGTSSPITTLQVNGSTLITGSLTVGSSSLGPNENTVTLGARDNASEGGQLGFNAPGGTYTSASMLDNYQNRFRLLRGTNAGSDAEVAWWSMHTKQMALPAYNSTSAFPGTAAATLAVDSSGNVITIAGSGGGTVTQVNTSGTVNGITLTGGPITTSGTITLGGTLSNVQSSQLATSSLMIGNSSVSLGATASSLTGLTSVTATSFTGSLFGTASWAVTASNARTASNIEPAITSNVNNYLLTATGTGTIDGESRLTFDGTTFMVYGNTQVTGSIIATQGITGSLFGTASWANNATTASFVTTAQTASYVLQAVSSSFATNASTASYVLQAVSSSFASTASFVTTAQTASFVTGSNVFGPFGSNSIISASYAVSASSTLQAVTASYALTSSFSLASSANTILVINKSGATISKGMVVHLTGSNNSSDTPYVITASYENDFLSANTLGIASETIAFNNTGFITTEGVLTGVDVTGFISGQVLYLGPAGSIIGSAPVAPLHGVRLGQVVRDSPSNNGAIYVRIDNGYEIGELHDVVDTSTTSSYGDLLVRSGSVWTNSRQLTGSYRLTGSLNVTDTVQIGTVLVDHVSVNPSISGLNTIYTQSTGSYTSAFMKYSVSSGSNTRAGEFMTAWNGTNIVYTDTSTTDIGNTAGVSFISSIVSSQLRVSASCTTSGWNIKTLSTFI